MLRTEDVDKGAIPAVTTRDPTQHSLWRTWSGFVALDSAEDGCRGGLPRGRGLWQPCWDLTWPPRRGFLETGEGEGICYKRKLPSPATWRPLSPIQVSCTFLDATFFSLKLSNFTYSIHILNTFNTLAVRSCSFPIIFPLDNTGKCAFLYIPD